MQIPDIKAGEQRYILFFIVLAVCLAGAGAWLLAPEEEPPLAVVGETGVAETLPAESASGSMVVYISGAVKKPGVYDMPAGSRVYELVRAAGDVIPYADTDAVNLAEPLTDGEKVHIPLNPEKVAVSAEPVVNINQAGLAELETLPGIGSVTAQKILDYRKEHGFFKEKQELMDVPSIGEGRYAKIKDRITL